ncbi:nuclear transport factor 2 family protein [Planococcus shenhongbingii]|uniref:Nuclear transport factor 2 family protein n=1 Tax=Planococcus shenhongbingii TaxID=3058398 RepID=A0ABT8NG57_9BACL|nr:MULTISPECIES: nuclear transport factor 2 family protein [unclassified Planococcus (in: firmicutes)]MDN7246816.1 nuclear transport factor 2 family protein [Planococcus sp. N017]WKA58827.1 nuclear transport factor 2 family protein [Planococcus sp. N016]
MTETIKTADAWVDKVNAKDIEGMLEVSDHNIELMGPRGSAVGHDTLQQWAEESGIHLTTVTRYAKGNKVVFEQEGTWQDQNGKVTVFTFMEVKNGKVVRISRFDTLDDAFGDSGLSEEDEI